MAKCSAKSDAAEARHFADEGNRVHNLSVRQPETFCSQSGAPRHPKNEGVVETSATLTTNARALKDAGIKRRSARECVNPTFPSLRVGLIMMEMTLPFNRNVGAGPTAKHDGRADRHSMSGREQPLCRIFREDLCR